jgi:amino acid transporter
MSEVATASGREYHDENIADDETKALDCEQVENGDPSKHVEVHEPNSLHKALQARHISMIAIGGAIGTGLIIGTGAALARAGPAPVFISYLLIGFVVYMVMGALGEMASYIPLASSFAGYACRYADDALGFSLGWIYWFKIVVVTPNQLTAAALVLQYWVPRDRVNPGVFITIFLVLIFAVNYMGIKYLGEVEFWLSAVKVAVICGLILLCFILMLGGGPTHDRLGFRYWKDPGAFKPYLADGSWGKFLAFWSSLITATFAFIGTELVGVTVGEARRPRKSIPRAIKLTFWRIVVFYVVTVFLLGLVVPYNSPRLQSATKATTSAAASPFVTAIVVAQIPVLPDILNGAILIFVMSAANTDLYIASRAMYGLAVEHKAPKIFGRTNDRGVPIPALLASTAFCLLAYMNVVDDSKQVFTYFVNTVTILGLITWIVILVSHIMFVRARWAQGVLDSDLVYTSPLGIWGSYVATGFCVVIALTRSFSAFVPNPKTYGNFDVKTFITSYIGIPVFFVLIFGYKYWVKNPAITPLSADLFTGRDTIDREEEIYRAEDAARHTNLHNKSWFYRTFISWLF